MQGTMATVATGSAAVLALGATGPVFFPELVRLLARHASDLLPLLLPMAAILVPAMLAIPVAIAGAIVTRKAAASDPEVGQAAAAGAGLGASAVALFSLGWLASSLGYLTGLVLLLPYALSAAFGVGIVGAAAFSQIPRRSRPALPGLYQGLTAASVGGLALLSSSLIWVLLGRVLPILSPLALYEAVGVTACAAILLAALAPVTWLTTRALSSTFRQPHRKAIGAGALLPVAIPALAYGWLAAFYDGGISAPLVATFAGFSLGTLPHFLAAAVGIGTRTKSAPALPGSQAQPSSGSGPGGDPPG